MVRDRDWPRFHVLLPVDSYGFVLEDRCLALYLVLLELHCAL